MEINEADIEKEILNLNGNKAYQISDMPIKIANENSNIFSSFLCTSFNSLIKTSKFLQCLKLANTIPLYKRVKMIKKEIARR